MDATTPNVPPVFIVIGNDIDASSMPLTFQRNRFVVDMLRHYACPPFLKPNDTGVSAASDVFEWYADCLPVVGVEDMTGYHDRAYAQFLSIRETLSEVDEFASLEKRAKAEEIQPVISRPTSYQQQEQPYSGRQLPLLVGIKEDKNYNITGDTTPFIGMWRTIQSTLSGTLLAVRRLADAGRFASVHWFGGRHHAMRASARGFCFVNDVVLGVLELKQLLDRSRNRILVVDIDAHHGDGTESAFRFDSSVTTLSMHAYGVGVYPGTGSVEEIGAGLGRGFTMNIPLPEGTVDTVAIPLVEKAIRSALKKVGDELGGIVIVCGSDALQGDPIGSLNLTVGGLQSIVRMLLRVSADRSLKVLILGAGGYIDVSCARVGGAITRDVLSCAAAMRRGDMDNLFRDSPDLGKDFGVSVPENCEYFTRYGPSFLMHGLPPARVEKVRELPRSSPLFVRIKRNEVRKQWTEKQIDSLKHENDTSEDDDDDDEEEEYEEDQDEMYGDEEGEEVQEEEEEEEDEEGDLMMQIL